MIESDVNKTANIERAALNLNTLIREATQNGLRVELRIQPNVESIGLGYKIVRAPEVVADVLRPISTKGHTA